MTPLFMASDHGGFILKQELLEWLPSAFSHLDLHDVGIHTSDAVDYPDIATLLAKHMQDHQEKHPLGLLMCGSGVGVSIAANRYSFLRAALANEPVTASLSRAHNNANVLCLGARLIGTDMAKECIKAFLITSFEGGRHEKRVQKLNTPLSL